MGEFIEPYALVLHPHQNQYRYHWWLLDMPVGMIEHDSAQGAVSNVKEKPTLQSLAVESASCHPWLSGCVAD